MCAALVSPLAASRNTAKQEDARVVVGGSRRQGTSSLQPLQAPTRRSIQHDLRVLLGSRDRSRMDPHPRQQLRCTHGGRAIHQDGGGSCCCLHVGFQSCSCVVVCARRVFFTCMGGGTRRHDGDQEHCNALPAQWYVLTPLPLSLSLSLPPSLQVRELQTVWAQ
jgi:hypothetical protein